jgi:hypothetical protein
MASTEQGSIVQQTQTQTGGNMNIRNIGAFAALLAVLVLGFAGGASAQQKITIKIG